MKEKFFNRSMIVFIVIGVLNTIISTTIMFFLHNKLGYWPSTAVAFALASIFSFFMNKRFTFENKESNIKTGIKFAIVIIVCYFISYFVAEKLTFKILGYLSFNFSKATKEKISMLAAQVLFPALNYIGQRFFAFKKVEKTD